MAPKPCTDSLRGLTPVFGRNVSSKSCDREGQHRQIIRQATGYKIRDGINGGDQICEGTENSRPAPSRRVRVAQTIPKAQCELENFCPIVGGLFADGLEQFGGWRRFWIGSMDSHAIPKIRARPISVKSFIDCYIAAR